MIFTCSSCGQQSKDISGWQYKTFMGKFKSVQSFYDWTCRVYNSQEAFNFIEELSNKNYLCLCLDCVVIKDIIQ
jgi:hypothetical protein